MQHVLASPHALGIAQALRAGLISVSEHRIRNRSPSRGGDAQQQVLSLRSVGRGSVSESPAAVGDLKWGSSSLASFTPSVVASPSPTTSQQRRSSSINSNGEVAPFLAAAAAQMAAFAEQALQAADAVAAAVASAAASEPASAAASETTSRLDDAGFQQQGSCEPASPGAVYEVLARKAREIQAAAAAAAETLSLSTHGANSSGGARGPTFAGVGRATSAGGDTTVPPRGRAVSPRAIFSAPAAAASSSLNASNSSTASSRASRAGSLGSSSRPFGGDASVLSSSFRGVVADGHFVLSSQSLGAAGAGASRPRAASPRRYDALGSASFKPALAGEANAPGSVWERMADPSSFTGVYRRAWESDGRINQYTETEGGIGRSRFVGSTNTGTDEHITDIRHLLRPNLLRASPRGAAFK